MNVLDGFAQSGIWGKPSLAK